MNRENLMDFLNPVEQDSLKDYIYLETTDVSKIPFKNSDYLKFMYRRNYQLVNGGIVLETSEWPVVKMKSFDREKREIYKINLNSVYVFYKRSGKMTRRDFFEELLENLGNGKLKKSS